MFEEFRSNLGTMSRLILDVPIALERLTYLVAYNYMLILMEKGVSDHPEGRNYTEMSEILVEHFARKTGEYIDMSGNTLVDEEEAGDLQDLINWQEAGYRYRWPRDDENYDDRLKVWIEIFEGTATDKKIGRNKLGQFQAYPVGPKTDRRTGRPVTYTTVIEHRQANRPDREKFPFWYPLNYGTNVGTRPGYPNVPGIGFKERAENEIPRIRTILAPLVEDYAHHLLTKIENGQPVNPMMLEDFLGDTIQRRTGSSASVDISRKKWLRKRLITRYKEETLESLAVNGF